MIRTEFSKLRALAQAASHCNQSLIINKKMSLTLNRAVIGGRWVSSHTGKEFQVLNPANGKVVGCVPDMDKVDTEKAIQCAYDTFHSPKWQNMIPKERAGLLKRWFTLLEKNREEIAKLMTLESGKPIMEAMGECMYGDSFVEWFAEETRRIYGEIIPSPYPQRDMMLIRQPIGVAALITPWNFPHAMITRKAAAALAAGCTVVIKPAEDTPLTALAIVKLAYEAGFPEGTINVVTSSRAHAAEIGDALCFSPKVAGLSFTGSTEVGKMLYEKCARSVKRVGLELGGNAPFIVFESADMDKVITGAMASKFRNCGQTCISANRFLIQENVLNEFVEKVTKAVQGLKIGDGLAEGVTIGPLINQAQMNKVSGIIEDARSQGANIICGGKPSSNGDLFYEPTIVTGVKKSMRLYTEEVFGPVVTIIPFKTEEEAITIANDTMRGLAGYFYSENVSQIFRVAKKLEVGMVGINEGMISCAEAAFGGVKESGIGREGSRHGIDDFVDIKYMCIGGLN